MQGGSHKEQSMSMSLEPSDNAAYQQRINQDNTNRFQYKNSECGVYSMHFIEEFLNGKSFEEITTNIFNDEEINKKRMFYYRPNQ